MKPIYLSKTFWFALLYLLVNLAGLFGYDTYQPDAQLVEIVGIVVAVVAIGLRMVTREGIRF